MQIIYLQLFSEMQTRAHIVSLHAVKQSGGVQIMVHTGGHVGGETAILAEQIRENIQRKQVHTKDSAIKPAASARSERVLSSYAWHLPRCHIGLKLC